MAGFTSIPEVTRIGTSLVTWSFIQWLLCYCSATLCLNLFFCNLGLSSCRHMLSSHAVSPVVSVGLSHSSDERPFHLPSVPPLNVWPFLAHFWPLLNGSTRWKLHGPVSQSFRLYTLFTILKLHLCSWTLHSHLIF